MQEELILLCESHSRCKFYYCDKTSYHDFKHLITINLFCVNYNIVINVRYSLNISDCYNHAIRISKLHIYIYCYRNSVV